MLAASACGGHQRPAPSAVPRVATIPAGTTPLFAGAPPARIVVTSQPLDVDPQGFARWLVRAGFLDASGRPTELLRGGNVDFVPSHGTAQWQTRLRFGGPAAIVSTKTDGPLAVRVSAQVGPALSPVSANTDTRKWNLPRIVAQALGPRAVCVGWFPRAASGSVVIVRTGEDSPAFLPPLAAPASGYVDTTVAPGGHYTYDVRLPDGRRTQTAVDVPVEPPRPDPKAIAGKKMWLSFSPSMRDPDGYDRLDPAAVVARAQAAGLHAIVLRAAYGPFSEITPDDKATVDALIDLATERGISTIAWTVPRSTSFEDVATEAGVATYATSRGNGFAALAVDLERGDYFLGDGRAGYAALAGYLRALRTALGPHYPIVATVEDPNLEHLTRAGYPYDAIAAYADVLQPMVYWRMAGGATTPDAVRETLRASHAATLREAGRPIPIDMGLQSAAEGPRGAPGPAELEAAMLESRALGAAGVTFFDWNGTPEASWRTIGATPW